MKTVNEIQYEVNARRHMVKTFWRMLTTVIVLAGAGAWAKRMSLGDVWFFRIWFSLCTLFAGITLFWVLPLMRKIPRGTVFRVTVNDGHISVESPHEHFGPSYKISLDEIVELRTVMSGNDVSRYEIQTIDGTLTPVTVAGDLHPPKAFEYIRKLRPNIVHRRV
jgi:hypothetical protein